MVSTLIINTLSGYTRTALRKVLDGVAKNCDIEIDIVERCKGCEGFVRGPHACPGPKEAAFYTVDVMACPDKVALIRALVNNKMTTLEKAKRIAEGPFPFRLLIDCTWNDASTALSCLAEEKVQARIGEMGV